MTRKPLLLACSIASVLFGSISTARAENLIEVYQAAAKSDPTVREAEARRLAALEVKPQARGLLLPQINVNGQYATQDSEGQSTFPQAVDDDNNEATPPIVVQVPNDSRSDSDYWTYEAQITQTLFRWDQWQALRRADSQVAVAEATYRAALQNLLVRVSRAYFDVLAAEDTQLAAEAALQAFSRQLEQAEKRFEVGLIAITDVQESRAAHDSATAGVIAAKRSLASAQETLRELTGEHYTALVKPSDTMPLDQPQPADEQLWVGKSLENNLDVIAARLSVDVATGNVRVAQGGYMPSIDLFAQRQESSFDTIQTNNGITGPADSDQTTDTIGVQVTIPIFTGGGTRSRVREQVYLQRAERERLEGTMRAAERETRDAYLGVIAEKARVQALWDPLESTCRHASLSIL